ncbi:MAG: nicotinamide-nucleotide adenylyltransferase [Thermoplasmata archaeon]|nr:nicotinamide-nucleotide adenylyltransferase [Thermoplasmata archaeon]
MARTLLIGRFQPFHRGHLAVVETTRRARPKATVLLGVGSAQASFTSVDPFTAGERIEMIGLALDEAKIRNYAAIPIPDIHRHSLWVAHVVSLVPKFERVVTNNPLTRLLFERAGYEVDGVEWVERDRFQGSVIRAALREGAPWESLVPPAVAKYLVDLDAAGRLHQLARDEGRSAPVGEP